MDEFYMLLLCQHLQRSGPQLPLRALKVFLQLSQRYRLSSLEYVSNLCPRYLASELPRLFTQNTSRIVGEAIDERL